MSLGQLAPGFVVGTEREKGPGVLRRQTCPEPAERLDSDDREARSFSVATLPFGDGLGKFRLGPPGGEQRFDEVPAAFVDRSRNTDPGPKCLVGSAGVPDAGNERV